MEDRVQFEPWSHLDGKIVFVTGASSGLGREFCLDLAKAGCKVVAAARRQERLKSLCDEINQLFPSPSTSSTVELDPNSTRAVAVELDVTADASTIETSVQRAWNAFGHIDALVNNAGVRGSISSSLDLTENEWNSTVRTNLTGAWLVSKYVGRHMREACTGGCIVNVSSISGLNRAQMRGSVAYSSSKAGMDSMTRIEEVLLHVSSSLPYILGIISETSEVSNNFTRLPQIMALELGEYKVRVNSISPGLFKSEFTEELVKKRWINNVAERTVPLRTFGTTDPALTSLVRFLIHDSSSYVSGNHFIVDAGYTLPGVPIFSSL